MAKNDYFQLQSKEDGIYLNIVKGEGGRALELGDLMSYCDKKNIQYYSTVEVSRAFEKAMAEGGLVKISDAPMLPCAGWCEYEKNPNNMSVTAVLYPNMLGASPCNTKEIMSDLANMKIKYGILNDEINKLVFEGRYFEKVEIARGREAIQGYDAEITYKFNTQIDTKPQMKEDGTVDYHSLELINVVHEGDVLAVLKPEYPGENGMDVMGAVLRPNKVYKKKFRYNDKVRISQDGLSIISTTNGHVTLVDDKVFVQTEFVIESDVGNATGDIKFDGDVHVKGSVLAGFKINATGNVIVDKVVEGAEIVAGGDIVLARGMQGMNKGILRAGRNIVAIFLESVTANAVESVKTDSILHSKVTCGGEIEISGRNGYVIGGMIRAGKRITAKTIGSEMGTNTVLGVGADPEVAAKVEELRKSIIETNQNKQKVMKLLEALRKRQEIEGTLNDAHRELFQKSMQSSIAYEQQLKGLRADFEKYSAMNVNYDNARIKVTGTIYPGVKLEIGECVLFIRDVNNYCQYAVEAGEIKRLNL